MNIPGSSSGHRPYESVDWTSSNPPRLPKHWAYLLPCSMTQEVELWGSSLLALLVKELVIQYSAMGDPKAVIVVKLTKRATATHFITGIVQGLAGMKKCPNKTHATTWIRNFFAFVFEEYGFGGARAWACHLFEAKIQDICEEWVGKKGK